MFRETSEGLPWVSRTLQLHVRNEGPHPRGDRELFIVALEVLRLDSEDERYVAYFMTVGPNELSPDGLARNRFSGGQNWQTTEVGALELARATLPGQTGQVTLSSQQMIPVPGLVVKDNTYLCGQAAIRDFEAILNDVDFHDYGRHPHEFTKIMADSWKSFVPWGHRPCQPSRFSSTDDEYARRLRALMGGA